MHKKQLILTFFILLLFKTGMTQAQKEDLFLMPFPEEVTVNQGKFRLTKTLKVTTEGKADQRLYSGASRFLRRLSGRTGLFFEQEFVTPVTDPSAQIIIRTERPGEVKLGMEESYRLSISENQVELIATTDIGALRGLETLLQLLTADNQGFYFPFVEIEDSPRFPWRGLMIDVARHFQPIHVIKRNIDGMTAVKMNVLHLHLTDDQGIRIESKIYPRLHELASEGEYFTQAEIKDIIKYADERGIRVIPEFDVPGHATSWLVAFPIEWYLSNWKQNHEQIIRAIPDAPLLRSVAGISKNLSTIAAIGLEALSEEEKSSQWLKQAHEKLKIAREPGARTELQIIDAIETLVSKSAPLE